MGQLERHAAPAVSMDSQREPGKCVTLLPLGMVGRRKVLWVIQGPAKLFRRGGGEVAVTWYQGDAVAGMLRCSSTLCNGGSCECQPQPEAAAVLRIIPHRCLPLAGLLMPAHMAA